MNPRHGLAAAYATVVTVALAALAACRFGGPSGNPSAYVTYPDDAASQDAEGADGGQDTADGQGATGGDDATLAATDGATQVAGDGGAGDDSAGDDVANGDGASSGCGLTIAVCNPIHNTGCNALQQCDVDTTQTTTPTGVCVFNSGADAAGPCTTSVFTESCAPQSTCVSGACRALCACDADCPAGDCCSDTSGPAGFTLCQKCP
jgi:hypothetical protein